uniref:Potassium voltage-gated channel, subfamily H (eag-related), member 3 n=2 Tax=Scleropages formosus TaxID=113540 RepID=A0A8C9T0I6_SCLFO
MREQVIKTNANVKALTYCDLQYISLKGLREVLRLYPEYAQKFVSEIQHDLTYNLREGHGADVDWESNGGLVNKLPSIQEDEEGDEEEQGSLSRATRSPLRLTRGLSSPLRSPLMPSRPFRPPTENIRPATLQIPLVSFSSAPAELSPRFVDGIETETSGNAAQKFEFSTSAAQSTSPPSLDPGIQEQAETRQSISKLSQEMGSLSQQVSQLSQEMQEITRLLRPLLLLGSQPILSALTPSMTPPPSSASAPSIGSPPVIPPPAPPCSPQPTGCSLIDSVEPGALELPVCLVPSSTTLQKRTSPQSFAGCVPKKSPPPAERGVTGGRSSPRAPSNGLTDSVQEQRPPTSRTTSPSLSFSLSISSSPSPTLSTSPCQGPHLSHANRARALRAPLASQDSPLAHVSHCSAPPSLSNSPGNHRHRVSPVSSSSTPLIPAPPCTPPSCPHPSPLSPGSLDSLKEVQACFAPQWHRDAAVASVSSPNLEAGHVAMEMQEWGTQSEHISFIDEEGPP